uniref:Uncharacterized protein n=1 Tax=Panagrolaimus sp. PS1159 TaxID=55785 RepID=A0AC35G3L1_9BILA
MPRHLSKPHDGAVTAYPNPINENRDIVRQIPPPKLVSTPLPRSLPLKPHDMTPLELFSKAISRMKNAENYNVLEPKKVSLTFLNDNNSETIQQKEVSSFFEEIKSKVNGSLGFICIYWNKNFDKKYRETFVQNGIKCGFSKVEILGNKAAHYYHAITQTEYLPKNGDIIGVALANGQRQKTNSGCYFFKQNVKDVKYLGYWNVDDFYSTVDDEFKAFYPNARWFSYDEELDVIKGMIAKIRMMDSDNEFSKYNIEPNSVIRISTKNVLLYDSKNKNVSQFPAAVDYGFDKPKAGILYLSPTVIANTTKNAVSVRKYYLENEIKEFYVLNNGVMEILILTKRVIIDLFREAITRLGQNINNIVITIPSNFSETQKELYLNASKLAGLEICKSVDESEALAYGLEELYTLDKYSKYILINFNEGIIELKVNQVGFVKSKTKKLKTLNGEIFQSAKLSFFDEIINAAAENVIPDTKDFTNTIKWLLTSMDNINLHAIKNPNMFVTSNRFYYEILNHHYSNFNIIFIKNPEEFIVRGASVM